ncbi:MAG: PIN domain-containing protein [Desulfurococcales archaeon]|nr:PIN domain-containing protein [Desulfurococcales archaeon]
MKLAIDTNILISALLHKRKIHDTVFYRENLQLYAPNLLLQELRKHREKIARLTTLTPREVEILTDKILAKRITIIPEETYRDMIEKAVELLKEVDISDAPFVALAMFLDIPLWTGDKGILELSARTGFKHFVAVDTEGVEMLLRGEPLERVKERMKERYAQDKKTQG